MELLAKISKAIVDIQNDMPHITLDESVKVTMKSGGTYSFKYASLPVIMDKIRPVLSKHRTAICQMLSGSELITRLVHESGEYVESTTTLPYRDQMSNQERGAVISYFRRYSIVGILGIVADEDDDANIADGNTATRQPPKASPNAGKPAKEAGKPEKAPEAAPLPPAASGKRRLTVPQVRAMCAKPSQNCTYAQLGKWCKATWAIDGLSQGEVIAEHSDEIRLYLEELHSDV